MNAGAPKARRWQPSILSATGDPGWIVADESATARSPGPPGCRHRHPAPEPNRARPSSRTPSTSGRSATGSRASRSSTARRRSATCSRSPAPSTNPATRRLSPRRFARPAFACGDDDLLEFRRGGGSFSLAGRDPRGRSRRPRSPRRRSERCESSARCATLSDRSASSSEPLTDRRLLQIAGAGPRARESWRRLRFVIEQARAFVEAGGGGLAEFAEWVDEQVAGNLRGHRVDRSRR